jgi:hypothetical protein
MAVGEIGLQFNRLLFLTGAHDLVLAQRVKAFAAHQASDERPQMVR